MFQHRGQRDHGCWNCGDLYHIGKRCRVPLFGLQDPRRMVQRIGQMRNVTFAQALQRISPPQNPQPWSDSKGESSQESEDEEGNIE